MFITDAPPVQHHDKPGISRNINPRMLFLDFFGSVMRRLTAFAGGFLIAPDPIDFDKVFVEFTRLGETGNYVVLSTVCGIFGVYVLVIIWARKADMLDERKVR